jgi:sulfate adenylyltransferase subunit 2
MSRLNRLENLSIHILREAYSEFKNLCMLWSIGKDSTVLLWLARKAFFGHVPIPLIHIDTNFKIPEMIEFRDRLAREWRLDMIYGQNRDALKAGTTYPQGKATRLECCRLLKTEALKNTVQGTWPRYRLNHESGQYEIDQNTEPFTGIILGIRADEEGSRSKERYFSARDQSNNWSLEDSRPSSGTSTKPILLPELMFESIPCLTGGKVTSGNISDRKKSRWSLSIFIRETANGIDPWAVHLVPLRWNLKQARWRKSWKS